jgi:hypothetical protein
MALPQNPLSDILIHNTLKTQNDSLSAQTKVLHKLSDSIMDQRKEFSELRKDIRNSQREFFQGNQQGMSSIQKYFEKYKSDNKSKTKDESSSTGFFKSAINKLFGPSKYQQKMMEEITRVRELTETTALNINFLRQANEEGPRKRERELLAKAIAEKLGIEIKDSQNGGDGEKSGGFLSSLISTVLQGGTLLVTFLGTIVVPILTGIITTLGSVGAAIVAAVTALGEMLLAAMGLNRIGGMGGGAGDVERNRNQNGRAGGGRIGPNGLPELEGPRQPRDMGTLKQNGSGAYVPEGATGGKGKLLAGILGALGLGALAGSVLYGTSDGEQETLNKNKENGGGGPLKWDDPSNPLNKIKKFFTDPMTRAGEIDAENEKKDKEIKEKDLEKQTDTLGDYTKKMNESIKNMLTNFEDLPKKMEKAIVDKLVDAKDFIVGEMDKLGEINFGTDANPQTVNLLPGLGTAVYDTLKEAYDKTEAMANKLAPNAQMFNQSITQNVTNGGTPTISAAQIQAEGTGTKMMDMFRTRRGIR